MKFDTEDLSLVFPLVSLESALHLDLSTKFLGCFTEVSSVFQESFKDVSRKFEGCLKKVSRVFQGSFKGVSRIIQGCFR